MSNITDAVIDKNNKAYDIHKRIYTFILSVIRLVNSLPQTAANKVIINQVLRSVTSMGANDQEADGALSRKDFIHCCTIVRKEGKETLFWLTLIGDTNPAFSSEIALLVQENKEIVAIISSIINNTRSGK